jgi:hypothetical protein
MALYLRGKVSVDTNDLSPKEATQIVRTSDGLGSEQVVAKIQGDVLPRGWSADGNYILGVNL